MVLKKIVTGLGIVGLLTLAGCSKNKDYGYEYIEVGEVSKDYLDKSSEGYDFTGDGLLDHLVTDPKGNIDLMKADSNPKNRGVYVNVGSIGRYISPEKAFYYPRVVINENGYPDLVIKGLDGKVYLYKNKK